MSKLIMLCGIPGSGKSEFAKSLKECGYVICSSDEMRHRLFGDASSQVNNEEVFRRLHEDIFENLRRGENVVYDACNINSKRRRAFLNTLKAKRIKCEKEAYVIATPYEICLEQNRERESVVPDEAITRMYRHWQTPAKWEGFDRVRLITTIPHFGFDARLYDDYDQNNPHHKCTLGKHLRMTAEYVADKVDDDILYNAALRHDIGKPFCEVKDENGISHYPDHSGVGAWDVLNDWEFDDDDVLEISRLITYHMYPIFWRGNQKTADKYKTLWGKEFYSKIMLLHEADVCSH